MMRGFFSYIEMRWVGLLVAAVVLGVDMWSKAWTLMAAAAGALPWDVWPGLLELVLAWNRGMSFSLLAGADSAPWVLGTVAVVACGWFVHWLGQREVGSSWWLHTLGLGMLIGGALGNLVDRVQHGAVVDMLSVTLLGWQVPFVFNLADAAISVGVAMLLWDALGQEILRVLQFWKKKDMKNA